MNQPVVSLNSPHRKVKTRERILAASERLFLQRGFENVSVEDILDEADVARSSFYRFFSNREDVLTEIVRPVFTLGLERLRSVDATSPRAALDGIFQVYLALWRQDPTALRLATRAGGVHFSLFKDLHHQFRTELTALVNVAKPLLADQESDRPARLIARLAVPILEVYGDDAALESRFFAAMTGLLVNPEHIQ